MADIKELLKNNAEKIDNYEIQQLKQLAHDPVIQDFLNKNSLDQNILKNNIKLFSDYVISRRLCTGCKSLADCRQRKKGEREELNYYNGFLYSEIAYCPYKLQQLEEDSQLNNFVYSDIPANYHKLSFNDVKIDKDNEALIALLKQYIKDKNKRGLYIYGDFGIGKTYLTIALANRLAKDGNRVAWLKTGDFVNKMRRMAIDDPLEADRIIEKLKKADILFFDDIGNESVSSYSRDDLLFTILDYRMENKKLTFFTSNQDYISLYQHYIFDTKKQKEDKLKADRLMERITILGKPYCLKGDNHRR